MRCLKLARIFLQSFRFCRNLNFRGIEASNDCRGQSHFVPSRLRASAHKLTPHPDQVLRDLCARSRRLILMRIQFHGRLQRQNLFKVQQTLCLGRLAGGCCHEEIRRLLTVNLTDWAVQECKLKQQLIGYRVIAINPSLQLESEVAIRRELSICVFSRW